MAETPLIKQYNEIKAKYPNTIILFRVGDFYETFGDDAIKTSKILGIVLTKRSNGSSNIELSGFPYHSLDTYLPKLVQYGHRVAICEQLEEPSKEKKLVKRGVTDLITPGLTTNDKILEDKKNNFLASIYFGKKESGVSLIDISTGEFYTFEGSTEQVKKIIDTYAPKEIIFEKKNNHLFDENFSKEYYTYLLDDWIFKLDFSKSKLLEFFNVINLKGFGIEEKECAIISAGAILQYLNDTNNIDTLHISKISLIDDDKYVWIDNFTTKNLELYFSQNKGATTLIDILDKTLSPMGGRMIKKWIALPLKEINSIKKRQNIVSILYQSKKLLEDIRSNLSYIGDLERWCSRISNSRISPKEIILLKESLNYSNKIKYLLENSGNHYLKKIATKLNESSQIKEIIENTLNSDTPNLLSKGNVIKENFNHDLEYYRNLLSNSKELLDKMLEKEIENTRILSLKIGFNNIFGYYFEVTNTHKDKVPQSWERRQTLTSAERYITKELKKFEEEILSAQDKIQNLESKLYYELIDILKVYIDKIQENGKTLGIIDCLSSFAFVGIENNYSCPEITEDYIIEITDGRHPIIEKTLDIDKEFIPNSIVLDKDNEQILIITGPNMSGKSAFLRQTAIITLMAQMGSFVPCKSAKIGIVDKVFSRVGASDNISSGESTFMVEMNETANILNNLTEKSLIILDEIGRGTSTYDGISIAWAITEYLHQCKERPKTIFATHYHELNEMEKQFDRIKNYSIGIKELDNKIFFTRKLQRGGSEHSFGIHVAEMAGIPRNIVIRANEILSTLENDKPKSIEIKNDKKNINLNIIEIENTEIIEIKDMLKTIELNSITPLEALLKLSELKNKIK